MTQQIIVTAYPKSGITWLVHLLCDLLNSPQQDTPNMEPLWWGPDRGGNYTISKQHSPFNLEGHTTVITPKDLETKKVIFLQRDPRDVAVSAVMYRAGNTSLVDNMQRMFRGITYLRWINSWLRDCRFSITITKYEDLYLFPYASLSIILHKITRENVVDAMLKGAIKRHSFSEMRQYMNDDHFMRKGIIGDWRNHFTRNIGRQFNDELGEFMLEQSYIDSLDWWKELPE